MSLPVLTWTQTASQSTGYLAPTDAQVINAIIANASGMFASWRVMSSLADTYIELGGPIGSPYESARIIICVNPGAGTTLAPDAQQNAIWIGLAPDGGTLGTWNTATPYGAARWMGYTMCAETAKMESFNFKESEEALAIFFRDDSFDNMYGAILGAIFDPLDFDAEADGRLNGIITGSKRIISETFWNSSSEFMSHSISGNYAHVYYFNPVSPTQRLTAKTASGLANVGTSTFKSANGKEVKVTPVYQRTSSPFECIGTLRQIYMISDRLDREVITGEGVVFATDSVSPRDAILFGNS